MLSSRSLHYKLIKSVSLLLSASGHLEKKNVFISVNSLYIIYKVNTDFHLSSRYLYYVEIERNVVFIFKIGP